MLVFLLAPLMTTLSPHFDLSKTRLETLTIMLAGLANGRTVNLSHLASQFPGMALHASSYRRLQRFFQHVRLDGDVVAQLIFRLLDLRGAQLLALDRTNWKLGKTDINILVLAIVTRRFKVPLMWSFLSHRGNSSTRQRIDLIERYLRVFGASSIEALLADREFVGDEWMTYLIEKNVPFVIRLREDMYIEGSVSEVYAWAADCCGEAGPRRCPPDHADEMEPSQIAVQVLRGDAAIAAQETLQLAVAAIDRLNVEGIPDPLSGRKVQGFVANAHGRSAGRIAAMTVRNQNDVGIQNRFEHRLQGLGVDRRKNLADGCAAAIGGDQDRHLFIRQAALAGLAATLARLAIQSARSLVALKHVSLVNFDNALEFRPILACGLQETVPPAEGRIDAKSASTGRFPYRLALGQRHAE